MVRIENIKAVKYGTSTSRPSSGLAITAPKHGFPPGSQVVLSGVEGIPQLEGQVFVVGNHHIENEFELLQDRWLDIDSIDAATATVRTRLPHQAAFHCPVLLRAFLDGEPVEDAEYVIKEEIDDFSLQLGRHKTRSGSIRDEEDDGEDDVEIASFANGAWSGKICVRYAHVVKDQETREDQLDQGIQDDPEEVIVARGGHVSLLQAAPKSIPECLHEWRSALSAVYNLPGGLIRAEPILEPREPRGGTLLVGKCGWDFCSGELHLCGHCRYRRGVVFIQFVPDIGMWCLFADVAPLDLSDERRELGLEEWSGPQLLYVCRGPDVTGCWDPVIGKTPAPSVKARSSTMPLFHIQPSLLKLQRGQCILWEPMIGSLVFDMLFSQTETTRSGTALKVVIQVLELFRDMCNCAGVCRAWRASLREHMCLTDMLYQVVYGAPRAVLDPRVPINADSLVRVVCHCRDVLPRSILQQPFPDFRDNIWGACVTSINVDGTEGQALLLFQYAKMLFGGHSLPWAKKPHSARDPGNGWKMNRSFFHTECIGGDSKAQCLFSDRHGVFASLGGKGLFDPDSESYAFLRSKGISVFYRHWGKSCITMSERSSAPCPMGRCSEPLSCECRVSHQLRCEEEWEFRIPGQGRVTMKLRFEIKPFFNCSTDLSLDISIVRPFLEHSEEVDVDEDDNGATARFEPEDDDGEQSEEDDVDEEDIVDVESDIQVED